MNSDSKLNNKSQLDKTNVTTSPSARFTRNQRLLTASDYSNVFGRACKQSNQHLTLLGRRNDLKQARLGLAIAKKQIRLAVSRNRIKRIIRSSFRQNQQMLTGFDIVVMVRHSILNCSNAQIFLQLEQQWQQLIVRCKKSS